MTTRAISLISLDLFNPTIYLFRGSCRGFSSAFCAVVVVVNVVIVVVVVVVVVVIVVVVVVVVVPLW